jgi:hypothetical protein
MLREYDEVRIRLLLRPPATYDGWGFNQRAPCVGDVGTIVDILGTPGGESGYVVECSGPDGVTIWLGDFAADELEPVRALGTAGREGR